MTRPGNVLSGRTAEGAAGTGWGVPETLEDRPTPILSARGLAFTGDTVLFPVVPRTTGVGTEPPVALPQGPPSLLSSGVFFSAAGTLTPGCLADAPVPGCVPLFPAPSIRVARDGAAADRGTTTGAACGTTVVFCVEADGTPPPRVGAADVRG